MPPPPGADLDLFAAPEICCPGWFAGLQPTTEPHGELHICPIHHQRYMVRFMEVDGRWVSESAVLLERRRRPTLG